ncbi:MAG TPA: tetratricopeptide repeat protein [Devosia sp.]|nr:tetratricopeptide repeat protein [Devosia sp.]
MTNTARLLSRSVLALLMSVSLGAAAGAATFEPKEPSATGAFLAGSEALFDLRTSDAARYFRNALEADWENPQIIERGFIAFAANGDIKESAEVAQRMLDVAPENELARLIVATAALKDKRYAAAVTDLESMTSETIIGITGGIMRAWALAGEGRKDEANAVLDELGAAGLQNFLLFHRALMDEVAGDTAGAIDNAKRAWETDPFVARIVEAYARILGNAGRFDEAADVIAGFEKEGYTHPLVSEVKQAVTEKRRPGAFADDVQTGAAEMFHGVGVALARDGRRDIATVFLRLALYLEPRADVIALVLGQVLDDAGEHDTANAIYDGVPAASPMKPTAVVRVAENLDSMGDRAEAIRRLGNIVVANPTDVDAFSVLGDLQRTDEKYAEAAGSYTKALELTGGNNPGDWRFYYVRGIAYERNKEWPKAEADFQKALALRPDQPQVLNYLGYSWVDQGINLGPALDMIEKAVAASPDDGYIIDSLGWAFFRMGRFDEAVEALEKAVQLRSNDPEINDHLGDAYWRAGRTLEAKFQWTIAAAVDEGGAVKERVVPKLANGLEPLPATVAPVQSPVAQNATPVTR